MHIKTVQGIVSLQVLAILFLATSTCTALACAVLPAPMVSSSDSSDPSERAARAPASSALTQITLTPGLGPLSYEYLIVSLYVLHI